MNHKKSRQIDHSSTLVCWNELLFNCFARCEETGEVFDASFEFSEFLSGLATEEEEEGIGIEDCEAMSRAINGPLDELDPVEQSYCLEVCSPGMNRELTRDEHFAAYLGAPVQVKLIRPDEDGQRVIAGILEDYRDSTMILRMEEGDERSVARKDASSVRLMDDDFGGIEE